MSAPSDPLALLSRALGQTGTVISRVRPEQAALPTPCRSWDVRELVNHVVLPFGEVPASWQVYQAISDMAVHAWDVAKATGR